MGIKIERSAVSQTQQEIEHSARALALGRLPLRQALRAHSKWYYLCISISITTFQELVAPLPLGRCLVILLFFVAGTPLLAPSPLLSTPEGCWHHQNLTPRPLS